MTSPPNAEIRALPARKALQIDIDPEIEVLLRGVLKPESWVVEHAPNNGSALELVEVKPYELIVTSGKMVAGEDVELLRKVRRLSPQTRLITVANENTPTDAITAMREHAFSYFSRPFSVDALTRMIRIAAERLCWDDGIEVISATQEWVRLRVRSDFESADRLLQFLQEIAGLPEPEKTQLTTASRELLYNAIEHGGKLNPAHHVEMDYIRCRGMVAYRIADSGPGFLFDNVPHAAIANPADDPVRHINIRQELGMRPGGYGVLMARQLVDEVIYNQRGNEVLLVKYLGYLGPAKSPSV